MRERTFLPYWGDRMIKRHCFFRDKKGTAEIVGTTLFLVILFFFFSNVFLWHDQTTRMMDQLIADKMNSAVRLEVVDGGESLRLSALGGKDVRLVRLWIIEVEDNVHSYIDFEELGFEVWVRAGSSLYIRFGDENNYSEDLTVAYQPAWGSSVIFKVLTNLGNTAAVECAF